ncbi:MAG: TIR domain-containing protein [Erysipelotrichaceae bacterium]|nr:TIR domain-containing protein [Erysipelotrichaceae bacterium]
MIYKCKVCGGTLNIDPNKTVCTCEYCGSIQTYPKVNSEKIDLLLSRADIYRRENQFDNAINLYNQILDEEKEDPEIYWLILLCQYGIEYVDDIRTHKRIPTVNRTNRFPVFTNSNYKKAIDLSDAYQRKEYEKEASRIDQIHRKILEISSQEKPYDIFICYKETDAFGNRTQDSVIAYDLYRRFTDLGYKVFFSKISLSDKLGSLYEPYIYSALNTSRILFLVITSSENVSSPWVKNEWFRFLSFMKEDADKHLIPCYKNVSPSSLPEEISYLQGIDMSGIGWEQDLEIAVERLLKKKKIAETESTQSNIDRLLDRASLYIRNNEFEEAYRQYDRVLDFDIKNENAYLGKLFSEFKVHGIEELRTIDSSILSSKNYQWLLNNGSEITKMDLSEAGKMIEDRIEKQNRENGKANIKKIVCVSVLTVSLLLTGFFAIKTIRSGNRNRAIQNASIGDVVTYGTYEQDNNSIDGKEGIEWIVLDKDDNSAILISRYVLDCQSYSLGNSYVAYDDSYIKEWLNEFFFAGAFEKNEQGRIREIRLLSTNEAKELFSDVSSRTGVATKSAISKGLEISSTFGNCEYWLVPSNSLSHYAAKVNANGSVNSKADNVNVGNGVRPVIIMDLK